MKSTEKNHNDQTLLIVDDDEAYCRVLSRALNKRDFSVWCAGTLAEATRAANSRTFDVAIVDLHLMDDNGLEFIEFLALHSPATKSILVSGYVTPTLAAQSIRLGAFECLAKPTDLKVLIDVLSNTTENMTSHDTQRTLQPSEIRLNHVLARWEKNHRNSSRTARELRMHRRTLQRILRREGITSFDLEPFDKPSRFTELRRLLSAWRSCLHG